MAKLSKGTSAFKVARNGATAALYRMHKPEEQVVVVVTLLAYGCPSAAIVAVCGWDARTVARHEHLVEQPPCMPVQRQLSLEVSR